MFFSDINTVETDDIIPSRPVTGGETGTNTDSDNDTDKVDDGPKLWEGEAPDVDGAEIVTPSLGWSPFSSIGGVGLNLPNFSFSGSGASGGGLRPAGVLLILALLAGGGYYLYKKYKK